MNSAMLGLRLQMEPLRSLDFGSISGTYAPIGGPLLHPAHLMFTQNLTAGQLTFSLDGVNDHFTLPAGGFFVMDVTTNKALGFGFFIPSGTQIYVKEITSPTSGSAYVTIVYANT
jgi:hypothetical protein